MAGFTLWLVGVVELVQKSSGQAPDPQFWMVLAVLITVYNGVRVFRLAPQSKTIRRSRASSAVKHLVEQVRSHGLQVYETKRDGGSGCVAVGRGGVYAIEVKDRIAFGSRVIDQKAENELLLGGRIRERRPFKEAAAAAEKIRTQLQLIVQVPSTVKPLVVFLGDWRVQRSISESNIPVLASGELAKYFDGQQPILSESEVNRISEHMKGPAAPSDR